MNYFDFEKGDVYPTSIEPIESSINKKRTAYKWRKKCNTAILAFLFPITLNAIGLGAMTVKSSLDHPFLAEIELLDVGNIPILSIKARVADPASFRQIGLNKQTILSLLQFKIRKNYKDKWVIKIESYEPIFEPYIGLIIDLTWPGGRLFKAYTVLLDPPDYQLNTSLSNNGNSMGSARLKQNHIFQKGRPNSTTKAELLMVTAAVQSLKKSNKQLMEQLHFLQNQNQKLQKQLVIHLDKSRQNK